MEAVKSVPPADQVTLAQERTYLAHERTLLAWTRTAISLITFGFTLYKFFEYLHEKGETARSAQILGARTFGLIMIGIGVLSLIVAGVQHELYLRQLRVHYAKARMSLALLLAGLIALLGAVGFLSSII